MKSRYPIWKKAKFLCRQIVPGNSRYGQIFFTKLCDRVCDYCRVANRETRDISLKQWKRIADTLRNWGVFYTSITGGEATIRKDLEEFISYLSRLSIFTSLNSNGDLLIPERIDSLAKAGLCSLVISLDSLKTTEGTKSDPGKVFELLAYAKTKGIIPNVKAVINPHDSETTGALAKETVKREFFFSFEMLQAVGGLFSRPSRHTRVISGMAQNQSGIWLPAELFQEATGISWTWKCNPDRDNWITVNNDGTLMVCQEWGSDIPILSIERLDNPHWRGYKKDVVERCPGCFYGCYYEKELLSEHPLRIIREELLTFINAWRMLH